MEFIYLPWSNLVPRALSPGFAGGVLISKARGKRPGDEVAYESNFQDHFSFFILLRGTLIKIARGCHTRWRNYFDETKRSEGI